VAHRDGYTVVVYGRDGEWRLIVSGETPELTE
jgi:hypothetical protein